MNRKPTDESVGYGLTPCRAFPRKEPLVHAGAQRTARPTSVGFKVTMRDLRIVETFHEPGNIQRPTPNIE